MKALLAAAACAALLNLVWMPSAARADEQKTVAECHEEWKAHRVKHWLKGMRERDYVARCRGVIAGEALPIGSKRKAKWRFWRVRATAPAPAAREATGAAWY